MSKTMNPSPEAMMEVADHFALNFTQIIELGMKVYAAVQSIVSGATTTQVIKGLKFAGRKWSLKLTLTPEA